MVIGETQNERSLWNVVVSYIATRTALLCKIRSSEVFIFEICSLIKFNEMYMVLEGAKAVWSTIAVVSLAVWLNERPFARSRRVRRGLREQRNNQKWPVISKTIEFQSTEFLCNAIVRNDLRQVKVLCMTDATVPPRWIGERIAGRSYWTGNREYVCTFQSDWRVERWNLERSDHQI